MTGPSKLSLGIFLDASITPPLNKSIIVNIYVINEQDSLIFSLKKVELIIEQVLKNESCECDEISVNFVTPLRICQLHQEFFDDDSLTDCITFPIDEEEDSCYRVLGEVFICPYTALKYAEEHSGDPYEELTLYIVHGLLHLLGYDDIEESDRILMRQAEERNMKNISKLKAP